MFQLDNSWQSSQNTRKHGLLTSITPIEVLVVDKKMDSLANVAEEVQSYSFEVTSVDHSGAALRLLTEKNNHYDLLLIDSNMTGVDIHTFLRLTKNMDLPSVVMFEQEDDAFIHEILKCGAFLVIKRPLDNYTLSRLRQDIIRQKIHKQEKCDNKNIITKNTGQDFEIQKNRTSSIIKKSGCHPKRRVHLSSDVKKTRRVNWTKELHETFLNALGQLGEGRCFPKKILELMDVPSLTRMQVASHFQKYQKEKLKLNGKKASLPSNLLPQELNEEKFGCMKSLQTDHEKSDTLGGIHMSINERQTQINRMNHQTYGVSSAMNTSNEKNIAQQIEYSQIPFGGDCNSGQGSNDQDLPFIPRQVYEEFQNFINDLDGNAPNGF